MWTIEKILWAIGVMIARKSLHSLTATESFVSIRLSTDVRNAVASATIRRTRASITDR
jgi:hypothetical protein